MLSEDPKREFGQMPFLFSNSVKTVKVTSFTYNYLLINYQVLFSIRALSLCWTN